MFSNTCEEILDDEEDINEEICSPPPLKKKRVAKYSPVVKLIQPLPSALPKMEKWVEDGWIFEARERVDVSKHLTYAERMNWTGLKGKNKVKVEYGEKFDDAFPVGFHSRNTYDKFKYFLIRQTPIKGCAGVFTCIPFLTQI